MDRPLWTSEERLGMEGEGRGFEVRVELVQSRCQLITVLFKMTVKAYIV